MNINLNVKLTHGKAVVIGWCLWVALTWIMTGKAIEPESRQWLLALYATISFFGLTAYTLIAVFEDSWHKQIGGDK